MASSLISLSHRSSSNQLLKSGCSKFSPIIISSVSPQNPIDSNPLHSNFFSHDQKKLLNPAAATTTTLSKFLSSTQKNFLHRPNPSFITSFSTCYYPPNLPKTSTHYNHPNWRNLGLRSFLTSSDESASSDQTKADAAVERRYVSAFANEMRGVLPRLSTNISKLSRALILLGLFHLCSGGLVSYQSFGAFAFPSWVAFLLRRSLKQGRMGTQHLLQILTRTLKCVKTLDRFFEKARRFTYFLLVIWVLVILSR